MAESAGRQLLQTNAAAWARELQWPLLVATAYYGAAESAFLIGTLSDRIFAPFWPPNIVLFCVLLLAPATRWWLYLAVIFLAHALAELRVGMDVPQLLFAFLTNVLVAATNAIWLRFAAGGAPWLGDLRKAAYYIVITAGVAPAVVALAGAFVPILGGAPSERYWAFWAHWYVGNALASLTLGPIVLTMFGSGNPLINIKPDRQTIEAVLIGLLLVTVCLVTFESLHVSSDTFVPALLYLPLPLVLWMTFRFGARGASFAILVVTVILIWHSLQGPSPFIASGNRESNVLALQLFLTGLSIPVLLLGAAVDQLRGMEATARKLAGSVLRAQDQERRRIARELHESTGQNLVVATLLLGKLQRNLPSSCEASATQMAELLRCSIADLRTMSYLLHPPLLDEAGLSLALRSYVEGFAARSGIAVAVDLSDGFDRLPDDVELALFRVAQEALTNVSRHSESKTAQICVRRQQALDGPRIVMTIENDGESAVQAPSLLGKPAPVSPSLHGVGLASMRERLHQIGGELEFLSGGGATLVRATVPLIAA